MHQVIPAILKRTDVSTFYRVDRATVCVISDNKETCHQDRHRMSSKLSPPEFIDDTSGYPEYKRELRRWSKITKIAPEKEAEVVLYQFKGHPSGIQEKVDTALGDEVIDKADGIDKLIGFLDNIYGEDEMAGAWRKYKDFVRLKKDVDQPVVEFVAEFDKKHKVAKQSDLIWS